MNKLREQIEKVLSKLQGAEKRWEKAGHRWQENHDKAHREHQKQKDAEHNAIVAGKAHHQRLAQTESDRAKRCSHRAYKAHLRAQHYVAKAKEYAQEVENLKASLMLKQKKLHDLENKGVHLISPNRVSGGTPKECLSFCMHYSEIHGSQFYSQTGIFTLKHGLQGPGAGHRHDCSSWEWSMLYSAGIPDPTGGDYEQNVWTGNEAEHGEVISERELDTGCAIYYGYAPFHHTELKDGPISESNRTVGHGSARIDAGVVALLPGPRSYRRFVK